MTQVEIIEKLKTLRGALAEHKGNFEIPETISFDDIPAESVDVYKSFGLNAPALLNDYACSLEDALIEQVNKTFQTGEKLKVAFDKINRLEAFKKETLQLLGIAEESNA